MGRRIILASASPRRAELLKKIVTDFEVIVSDCSEDVPDEYTPDMVVTELASRKANAVADSLPKNDDVIIIASDTVVAIDGKILGKPFDRDNAYMMLKALAGRPHYVYSGVCILNKSASTDYKQDVFYEKTEVNFSDMTDEEIYDYIDSGEPYDKAGAYGIQGLAGKFIKSISGDYYNVVGLPVAAVYEHIKKI